MGPEFWIGLMLGIPMSIVANILTIPIARRYVVARRRAKMKAQKRQSSFSRWRSSLDDMVEAFVAVGDRLVRETGRDPAARTELGQVAVMLGLLTLLFWTTMDAGLDLTGRLFGGEFVGLPHMVVDGGTFVLGTLSLVVLALAVLSNVAIRWDDAGLKAPEDHDDEALEQPTSS